MKQLTCEMCGSTNLIKQDGVFICQSCGTKYSIEEAKKMMIEGTVDVSGSTVKVDNSASIQNFLDMAENAIKASNGAEAVEYANKALEIDPESSKAWLVKMKAVEHTATIGDSKVTETVSYAENAIKFAAEEDKESTTHEVYKYYLARANTIMLIAISEMQDTAQLKRLASIGVSAMKGVANGDSTARSLYINMSSSALLFKMKVPEEYIRTHEDIQESVATLAKLYGSFCEADAKRLEIYGSKLADSAITARKSKLESFKKGLPEEKASTITDDKVSTNSNAGCYVATCVYGSYDCPQVWTLRRYRDNTLAKTWYGRLFIHTYYAISPTIVKWFGNTEWFRNMWKGKLDKMVSNLNSEGVEDTPYEDQKW